MSESTLYIGNKNYSSWSLRPWLALKQAGAEFEEVVIPLDRPETMGVLQRHAPSQRVPVLTRGALTVWESLSICEYAAELFPAARLWPQDRELRAVARSVANEMHAGFAALRNWLPMDIRSRFKMAGRTEKAAGDIARVTRIWQDCRKKFGVSGANGPGPFLFGGFTIADAMFAPVTTRFVTYGVPLDSVCAAYVEAVTALPAMQSWIAAAKVEPWTIIYDVNK
ncbi:MAG: glutathione S-transferase family protein [Dongiaceae bacterium]